MSHIHFPDGILPFWLWLLGFIVVALYFVGFGFYLKKNSNLKKLPLVGVFAALMLVTMSIHIVPIGYHLNLAVLTGIIVGPVLAPLVIFIVNLLLSLIGHGGVTTVGLNTIVISVEAIVGFFGFNFLKGKIKNIFLVTFISTVLALFVSTCTSISIVYFGTNSIESLIHKHDNKNEDSQILKSSLLEKFFDRKQLDEEEKVPHDIHEIGELAHEEDHISDEETNEPVFDLKRFALIVLLLGFIGWLLEGLITAFIVKYINKIKPDLLER